MILFLIANQFYFVRIESVFITAHPESRQENIGIEVPVLSFIEVPVPSFVEVGFFERFPEQCASCIPAIHLNFAYSLNPYSLLWNKSMNNSFVELTSTIIETLGIGVIAIGALHASVRTIASVWSKKSDIQTSFQVFRRELGRAILLGLEFLVAGDIIRTVAVEPTFRSIGILAIIVVIRTFLSFSLEVEMNGRWPWDEG